MASQPLHGWPRHRICQALDLLCPCPSRGLCTPAPGPSRAAATIAPTALGVGMLPSGGYHHGAKAWRSRLPVLWAPEGDVPGNVRHFGWPWREGTSIALRGGACSVPITWAVRACTRAYSRAAAIAPTALSGSGHAALHGHHHGGKAWRSRLPVGSELLARTILWAPEGDVPGNAPGNVPGNVQATLGIFSHPVPCNIARTMRRWSLVMLALVSSCSAKIVSGTLTESSKFTDPP